MNDPLVVDASVAIKWVIEEADAPLAGLVMAGTVLAPDLIFIECGSAIWRRTVVGDLPADVAGELLRGLRRAPLRLVNSADLVDAALDLALVLRHPIYDCLYLALAIGRNTRLITADRRFAQAVRRHQNLADRVALLGELAH